MTDKVLLNSEYNTSQVGGVLELRFEFKTFVNFPKARKPYHKSPEQCDRLVECRVLIVPVT